MHLFQFFSHQPGVITRQINAENPNGEKSGACKWEPNPQDPMLPHSTAAMDLGKGWKVRPFIQLKAGDTASLADIHGPGCINHLWITSDLKYFSELVLRFYWDHEETPSIEVPLGAFFAMGHDFAPHTVNSMPIVVAPDRACNSYWQMPFRKHAKVTISNEGLTDAGLIAYKILYKLHEVPDDTPYFHASYRRSMTTVEHPEHTIIDGVLGKGLYVGTYLAWNVLSSGWWGEGEVKFYLDGDTQYPTISDNGTEDYFGGAWNFGATHSYFDLSENKHEQVFHTPFLGMPLAKYDNPHGPRKYSLYRWHFWDSIGFAQDLRVTVQALGWYPNRTYRPLTDDIASVAYWYQLEPHQTLRPLPTFKSRWDR